MAPTWGLDQNALPLSSGSPSPATYSFACRPPDPNSPKPHNCSSIASTTAAIELPQPSTAPLPRPPSWSYSLSCAAPLTSKAQIASPSPRFAPKAYLILACTPGCRGRKFLPGVVLQHRGRPVTPSDVAFIRKLIATNPRASRRALSVKLCEAWGWRQANGAPRDMVCRGLMLALHRAGHIELPEVRKRPPNPLARHGSPKPVEVDETPVRGSLAELGLLRFSQVRRTGDEPVFNGLVEEHHYLGYTQPVGEHLKFMVYAGNRPVSCFAWSSAPRHLGPRDRYIGWSAEARRNNVRFVAYNTRFLVLPWVRVPHLASHLLGRMARMLPLQWEQVYNHRVHFAETFVDPARFAGTCYRAANWVWLGRTTGRGKDDQTNRPNRPIKDVLGLPLCRRWRELLRGVA